MNQNIFSKTKLIEMSCLNNSCEQNLTATYQHEKFSNTMLGVGGTKQNYLRRSKQKFPFFCFSLIFFPSPPSTWLRFFLMSFLMVVRPKVYQERRFLNIGKLLSSKFGIQKLTKGKFLNYLLELFLETFRETKTSFPEKKNIFME